MNKAIVITSIFEPTHAVRELEKQAKATNSRFVVVADTKTPEPYGSDVCDVLTVQQQKEMWPQLAELLPWKHYSRKNLGYLYAVENGAEGIIETDDDNIPCEGFMQLDSCAGKVNLVSADFEPTWCNVYNLFGGGESWPRGFPLSKIRAKSDFIIEEHFYDGPVHIVQGLADDNPDVDAIYRLSHELPLKFNDSPSVVLDRGVWCPFNSQNTFFSKASLPLMYLPSYCSFQRNEHDLMKDFADEIPGYLNNERICQILTGLQLKSSDPSENLHECYESLCNNDIFSRKEMNIVEVWLDSCNAVLT